MKIEVGTKSFFIPNILTILLIGFIARILFSFFGTYTLDQNTFISWSNSLVDFGFSKFYLGWSDYFPGYMYILWLLGKIQGILPSVFLYKAPAILADLGTGYLIYRIIKKLKGEKLGLIFAGLYLFNPAILANSTFWGQIDSLTAFFVVLTIYLLDKNYLLSAISLAAGTLIKPQAPFIVPVLLGYMIIKKWKIKKIILYAFFASGVFILAFLPFLPFGESLFSFIVERVKISSSQYPYGSINAFNFLGLWGFWQPDMVFGFNNIVGYLIIGISFIFYLIKVKIKQFNPYVLTSIILAATFLFLPRMHERHLLPFLAPLLISAVSNPNLVVIYIGFSLTYVFNLLFSFFWINNNFSYLFPQWLVNIIILLNIGFFFFMVWESFQVRKVVSSKDMLNLFAKIKKYFQKDKSKAIKNKFPKIAVSSRTQLIILTLIILFAFLGRTLFLKSPPNEYFDEVYHAFTAREMLNGNPAAWEWWNTPPEGFAYEWTHPPLAKLGMWFSMLLLGENSFSWRLPQAILGTLSVFLVFLLARELFKDRLLAVLAAGIYSLDGLVLSMSRIGMNDIYLVTFVLLTFVLFLKKRNFWSALAFGLAISSKWSAVWLIPVLGVIFLGRKLKFKLSYLWFIIIPPLVYLGTYIPMFLSGHNLEIFWGMQKQMWWYHTGLVATHAYSSFWWTWPLLIRPVYLYTSEEVGGMVARIYNLGNPVVFWFGLVSFVISFIYSLIEKNKMLALTVFSYLIFFVGWAGSPRIMFFYHYLPAVPFLSILIAYILRRNPKYILPIFSLALSAFVYFYPHWIGIEIPLWLDKSYYWFNSWR